MYIIWGLLRFYSVNWFNAAKYKAIVNKYTWIAKERESI